MQEIKYLLGNKGVPEAGEVLIAQERSIVEEEQPLQRYRVDPCNKASGDIFTELPTFGSVFPFSCENVVGGKKTNNKAGYGTVRENIFRR